jgi:hypothetical protein
LTTAAPIDTAFDLLDGLEVDERTLHDAIVEPGSDGEPVQRSREPPGELVMHRGLHEKSVGADAGLAAVAVLRGEGAFDGRVEVGIVEHDKGRVAAELERDFLDSSSALGHQDLADGRRSGERDLPDGWIRRQLGADLLGRSRDNVQHAGWEAGPVGEDGQRKRGERGLGSGFHDGGAPSGNGWPDLAGDHGEGEVPRRNAANHPDRLLDHDETPVAPVGRDRLAVSPLRLLGEPFEEQRAVGDLRA